MPQALRLIHASSNGDRWFLCRRDQPGAVSVRHEPNAASGGQVSHITIGQFLRDGANGPEHHALLAMIGSLAADAVAIPLRGAQPEPGAAAAEPTPGEAGL